jgi:hypothetical protein
MFAPSTPRSACVQPEGPTVAVDAEPPKGGIPTGEMVAPATFVTVGVSGSVRPFDVSAVASCDDGNSSGSLVATLDVSLESPFLTSDLRLPTSD